MSDQHPEDRDTRVARRAYEKWEAEGRPAGRHDAHWHDAAAEVDADPIAGAEPEAIPEAERGAVPEKPKSKRAPKKAATPTGEAKPTRARKSKSPAA